MKRIFSLLLTVLLMLMLPLTALAQEVPDLTRKDCAIRVQVRYDGKKIEGGKLTAVRVGYVAAEGAGYVFRWYKDDSIIGDVSSREFLRAARQDYERNAEDYVAYTQKIRKGLCEFTGLTPGLYLVVQSQASPGYSPLNAFLVTVPYMQDGTYQYDVTADAKSSLEKEPESTTPTKPPASSLPQTGQTNWPIPVLAVVGMLLFAAGWLLCFGRRKDSCTEK